MSASDARADRRGRSARRFGRDARPLEIHGAVAGRFVARHRRRAGGNRSGASGRRDDRPRLAAVLLARLGLGRRRVGGPRDRGARRRARLARTPADRAWRDERFHRYRAGPRRPRFARPCFTRSTGGAGPFARRRFVRQGRGKLDRTSAGQPSHHARRLRHRRHPSRAQLRRRGFGRPYRPRRALRVGGAEHQGPDGGGPVAIIAAEAGGIS